MPRYDYVCETCDHQFEVRQSFDSEPVATCPRCDNTARRKFHAVPIVFKGSGWYVNDYGKKSYTSSTADSGSSSNGASESGASKAKEAKDTASTGSKDGE